ncbi:haloacid dehalogenase type II [Microbacterium sp. Root553]|uniref:haloacid dehalogenase type II n=1 Tax=Microbacterium sp. Root553 TaxID=1736556 RepID=UPI0006FF07C2|nr:haloacid dehalogenase type II [Microbacterium sp. Root553]KQZ23197.1 HAD family hydrolase [Microbacterium sp. Root553]
MTSLGSIDTIVFDILGTLVDHNAGIRTQLGVFGATPDAADELTSQWHSLVGAEHARIVRGERDYAAGKVLDREAARTICAAAGISDPAAVDSLVDAAGFLPPWPDSADALARLSKEKEIIGLSNADTTALLRMNARAGLRWHSALSTQAISTYKPDPAVYQLATRVAGRDPDRILMVAAHSWDLRGAQAAGLRTAYLNRPTGDPPTNEDMFDFRFEALSELVDAIC